MEKYSGIGKTPLSQVAVAILHRMNRVCYKFVILSVIYKHAMTIAEQNSFGKKRGRIQWGIQSEYATHSRK